MAASKDPAAYPAAFHVMIQHFENTDAPPVKQHFPRAADAAKLRFTFYNFKRALRNSGDERGLRVANGVIVSLVDLPAGGADLTFSLRDNADFALGLEEAIKRAQGNSPPRRGVEHTHTTSEGLPTSDDVVNSYLAKK